MIQESDLAVAPQVAAVALLETLVINMIATAPYLSALNQPKCSV